MSTPRFLDLPPGVAARTVPTRRGDLAVLEARPPDVERAAPAVLLPGWTGSKEDFIALLAPLAARGHHVVSPDLPGQYQSPPADPATYTLDGFADAALALAESLAEGRGSDPTGSPAHLVGHSFGGLVARTAVVAAPSAWRSLTLLCSGPGALPAGRHFLMRAMVDGLDQQGLGPTWDAKRAFDLAEGAIEPPHEIEEFLRRRWMSGDVACLRAITVLLTEAPDGVAELAGTGIPVLVARGEDDDAWPPEVQTEMARRLGVPCAVLPGAAHSPAVEQPEETAELLAGFWAQVDARGVDAREDGRVPATGTRTTSG